MFPQFVQQPSHEDAERKQKAEARAAERWPWLIDPEARWNRRQQGLSMDPQAGVKRLDQRMVRVLAIDGGGIRGIVPATILAAIEERTGRPVSDFFDVFAGTSTGGLLTLGLNTPGDDGTPKYTAKQIRDVYVEQGPRIFSRRKRWFLKTAGGWLGPKYPATGLEAVLKDLFGERRISESIRRTLVTSYDTERRTPVTFASDCRKFAEPRNPDPAMWEVCRATSAAPTYFPPFRLRADWNDDGHGAGWNFGDPFSLVDGGVAANNPALWAWYESGVGREAASLLIVSLGTGIKKGQFAYERIRGYGKLQWVTPVLELLASGANETTHTQLNYFLNGIWQDPRDRDAEGRDQHPNRPVTSLLSPPGVYDVNTANNPQRTRWTRYLRFQPHLREAQAAMDNVSRGNLAALVRDAERYREEHSKDIDELADFLDTLADLRPAFGEW